MDTVCHIRGDREYWLNTKPPLFFTQSHKEDIFYYILDMWNSNLKIDYFSFRYEIRKIVISYLTNMFDIILYDNEQCKKFFSTNKNIILYQQDDDDIIYEIPTTKPGLNVFFYSHIDCVNMRRSSKNTTRSSFYKNNKLRTIQSNHVIIDNTNKHIDLKEKKIWDKDHTYYDRLIKNKDLPIHFIDQAVTTQFYHLTSLSGLYNMINNKKELNKNNFKDYTASYIHNLSYINKKHQLINNFKTLYSNLL